MAVQSELKRDASTQIDAEPDRPVAYVAGTFDTKSAELDYLCQRLVAAGVNVTTVDLSTSGKSTPTDITSTDVAACHPSGGDAVFGHAGRGDAITAMAEAFSHFVVTRSDLSGIIGAGGSGGTALLAPGFRALPVGVPKVLVSTVASGNVAPYVGSADITMMYSVTDVQGLNNISKRVLGNAAHALAGMITFAQNIKTHSTRSAIGLTMFGVTTPCVQSVTRALESTHDCLVFHATGTGGQSMEKLAESGLVNALVDLTTTEIADMLVGGIFAANDDRMGAAIRTGIPYIGSVGALDMVNFGSRDSVPERFEHRHFHIHNPQVTLMRTTPAENHQFGVWIGERLNRMSGPVRFLIPELGVSMLDAVDQPFYDIEADTALFDAIESTVSVSSDRQVIRVDANINDPVFCAAVVENFYAIAGGMT